MATISFDGASGFDSGAPLPAIRGAMGALAILVLPQSGQATLRPDICRSAVLLSRNHASKTWPLAHLTSNKIIQPLLYSPIVTIDGETLPGRQEPSPWILRFLPQVLPVGKALDVAAGSG